MDMALTQERDWWTPPRVSEYEHAYRVQMGCKNHARLPCTPPSSPPSPLSLTVHRQQPSGTNKISSSRCIDVRDPSLPCTPAYTSRRPSSIPPQFLGVLSFPNTPTSMSSLDASYSSSSPAGVFKDLVSIDAPRGENESITMGHNQSTPAKNDLQQVSGDVTSSSQTKNMSSSETSTVSSSSAGIVLSSPISSSEASIMSSRATMPSTQVATPMPKKRGRPPKIPKETSTATIASSAPSIMSSLQAGTTSSAATIPAIDDVKPPARKRGRPPKLNKGPPTSVVLASNANQALPKKRGRPPKQRNVLPSNAATNTAKRQKTRFKDRDRPTGPTSAELTHLEVDSYRIDKDDGRLFWLLPDGAEPEYLPHPGRGKKYQWGFEYSILPEDYEGDDSDAGLQLWLNAKYQNSTGYEPGSYPLGDEEDAEGESDEFDAARGLTAMGTHDPETMSPASDPHDGPPAPLPALKDVAPAQTAPELKNTQVTANDSRDAQPLREMQTPQPVAGCNGRAATATNGLAGGAPEQPKTKRDLEQLRQRVGPTRWWCNNPEGVRGYFEQKKPPPKNWAEIGYPGFQVSEGQLS